MEKAFDTKVLGEKLKEKGLVVAEVAAEEVVHVVVDWLQESVLLSENKFDDIAVAFLPQLKAALLEQIEKIDGK